LPIPALKKYFALYVINGTDEITPFIFCFRLK
jgi:hypothetical protein